jgi:hypothetical protein
LRKCSPGQYNLDAIRPVEYHPRNEPNRRFYPICRQSKQGKKPNKIPIQVATMRQIAFVLVGLFPLSALGQGEIEPTESDLRTQVSQIAGLVVQNTDGLESLRDQVAGIAAQTENNKTLIQELLERVSQLESNPVVPQPPAAIPTFVTVANSSPTVTAPPAVVYSKTRTVTRSAPQNVRQPRTPIRSMFQRFFLSRRNVTGTSVSQSSGNWVLKDNHWSWPGDIYQHLAGPPHYVDASALSYSQAVQLHNSLHAG